MPQYDESALGWVYVLSNPSMPGRLKIGFTDRTVPERVSELSAGTGVPTPFVWEYGVRVTDARSVERTVHRELSDCRLSSGREFFGCEIVRAIEAILSALEAVEPLEVHDRQRKAQAAAALHAQTHLAEQWRDGCLTRLRVMREDLEREVGVQPLGAPFLGYALASYLVLEFVFDGEKSAATLVLSVIAGGVLALIHQAKMQSARRDSVRYRSRLESIEQSEGAVRGGFDNALALVRQGRAFAEIESTLAVLPDGAKQGGVGDAGARTAAPQHVQPERANGPSSTAERVPISTADRGQPTGTASRLAVSDAPRFFGCDRCKRTVNLNGPLSCFRSHCPAKQIKTESKSQPATPIELSGWRSPGSTDRGPGDARQSAATRDASSGGTRRPGGTREPTTERRYCVYCRNEVAARVDLNGGVLCLRCRSAL